MRFFALLCRRHIACLFDATRRKPPEIEGVPVSADLPTKLLKREARKEITPPSHSSHLNIVAFKFTKRMEASGSREIRLPGGAAFFIDIFRPRAGAPLRAFSPTRGNLNRDDQPT
ncbi:hypothetical protein [Shinella sp.]|uniref:hypothetical protein n=1 Tax=Shinella sp. TaxID=1870904 RepID=UPI00258A2832|nr:hypothetical protein [Shinella sp.]MCW5711917.1 hypothetical protein [Shinella sp.]